jgi:hypothetical protein
MLLDEVYTHTALDNVKFRFVEPATNHKATICNHLALGGALVAK